MITSLLIRVLGSVLSCVVLGCTTKKVLKFTPLLANEFGHAITVEGTLGNGMVLGIKNKGAEDDYFIFVEKIEGDKVGKVEEIEVVGIKREISDQLWRFARASKRARLIGCEVLESRGMPDGLWKYVGVGSVPQSEGWHVRRVFIVVKCDVMESDR